MFKKALLNSSTMIYFLLIYCAHLFESHGYLKHNIFAVAAAEDPGVPRQREGPQPGGGQNELHQSLAEPPGIWSQPLCGQVGHQALQSLSEYRVSLFVVR